jgi:large subunit ribosomal protein L21
LEGDANAELEFDKVLLVDNDGTVSVGAPTVKGAKVKGTILEHLRGDKVIVFKKKRRKSYQKSNGHRQYLTKVMIDDIVA